MKKQYYLLLGLLFICVVTHADTYKLHTLYMYSFSRHIQWPQEVSQGDFKIGIVGESPIVEPLQKRDNRFIKAITFASLDEIRDCNILSLNQSENFPKTLNKVGDSSILLVTEKGGLETKGSAINFVINNNRLMFEINNDAINKANMEAAVELKKYAVQF